MRLESLSPTTSVAASSRSPCERRRVLPVLVGDALMPDAATLRSAWENRALPITEIDLLQIIPGRGLHMRTRQESWLISLPEELQSDDLLRAITSGDVNCLSGSCEPF